MTTIHYDMQLKTAPGPQSNYLTGNLRDLQRNQLRFFLNLRREYGDVARFRILGSVYMHMIFHPEGIEEDFDPERFTPQRSAGRPHFAYFPFGGGPHLCIGNNFALMEAQLILATVAQVYQLRMAPRHPPVIPEPLVTLRPRNGIVMTVQKRNREG
jgi:cytochrome P450